MTEPGLFEITFEPIAVERVLAALADPSVGGVTTFVGCVRNVSEGHAVDHLEYEAYSEMAEKALREIGEEVKARWRTVKQVAIVHRVGRLEVGEVAVVIAVSAAHRGELFDALRYSIDRLKQIAPIWKKEIWQGGSRWVSEK